MKVAIAARGKTINSRVSDVSGRAPYFLIFQDGRLIKAIANPFKRGGGGAGFGVAAMLADKEVSLVISGRFGVNMISALQAKRIKYRTLPSITIKEVLDKINL